MSDYAVERRSVFSMVLPGWHGSSCWVESGWGRIEKAVLARTPGVAALVVPARPGGAGSLSELALALVERLDLDPEVVVAGMGVAFHHPVLRPAADVEQALVGHRRDDGYGAGERAALRWVAGHDDRRPGSRRHWQGGHPSPWQVEAERRMAEGRVDRGEQPDHYSGVRDRLLWTTPHSGSAQPWRGDRWAWAWRRLRRLPVRPYDPSGPECTVRRGREFRSWDVVNRDGLLGTVRPAGTRRWVGTVEGEQLSDQVHRRIADAAYEVMRDAFRTGRARADPTGWAFRTPPPPAVHDAPPPTNPPEPT